MNSTATKPNGPSRKSLSEEQDKDLTEKLIQAGFRAVDRKDTELAFLLGMAAGTVRRLLRNNTQLQLSLQQALEELIELRKRLEGDGNGTDIGQDPS